MISYTKREYEESSKFKSGFLTEISNDSLILNKTELLKVFRKLKLLLVLLDPHISMWSLIEDWGGLTSSLPGRGEIPKCSPTLVFSHFCPVQVALHASHL